MLITNRNYTMTLSDFYHITKIKKTPETIECSIQLNVNHELYKGHFPSQPVLPGIMQIEIIQDILSQGLEQKLSLIKVINIKYLNMIVPDDNLIQFSISYVLLEQELKVKSIIQNADSIFTKFSGIFAINQ